jgi:hypothetical protein
MSVVQKFQQLLALQQLLSQTSPSSGTKEQVVVNVQQLQKMIQLAAEINARLQLISASGITCDQVNTFTPADSGERRLFCGTLLKDGKKKCAVQNKLCVPVAAVQEAVEAAMPVAEAKPAAAAPPPPPAARVVVLEGKEAEKKVPVAVAETSTPAAAPQAKPSQPLEPAPAATPARKRADKSRVEELVPRAAGRQQAEQERAAEQEQKQEEAKRQADEALKAADEAVKAEEEVAARKAELDALPAAEAAANEDAAVQLQRAAQRRAELELAAAEAKQQQAVIKLQANARRFSAQKQLRRALKFQAIERKVDAQITAKRVNISQPAIERLNAPVAAQKEDLKNQFDLNVQSLFLQSWNTQLRLFVQGLERLKASVKPTVQNLMLQDKVKTYEKVMYFMKALYALLHSYEHLSDRIKQTAALIQRDEVNKIANDKDLESQRNNMFAAFTSFQFDAQQCDKALAEVPEGVLPEQDQVEALNLVREIKGVGVEWYTQAAGALENGIQLKILHMQAEKDLEYTKRKASADLAQVESDMQSQLQNAHAIKLGGDASEAKRVLVDRFQQVLPIVMQNQTNAVGAAATSLRMAVDDVTSTVEDVQQKTQMLVQAQVDFESLLNMLERKLSAQLKAEDALQKAQSGFRLVNIVTGRSAQREEHNDWTKLPPEEDVVEIISLMPKQIRGANIPCNQFNTSFLNALPAFKQQLCEAQVDAETKRPRCLFDSAENNCMQFTEEVMLAMLKKAKDEMNDALAQTKEFRTLPTEVKLQALSAETEKKEQLFLRARTAESLLNAAQANVQKVLEMLPTDVADKVAEVAACDEFKSFVSNLPNPNKQLVSELKRKADNAIKDIKKNAGTLAVRAVEAQLSAIKLEMRFTNVLTVLYYVGAVANWLGVPSLLRGIVTYPLKLVWRGVTYPIRMIVTKHPIKTFMLLYFVLFMVYYGNFTWSDFSYLQPYIPFLKNVSSKEIAKTLFETLSILGGKSWSVAVRAGSFLFKAVDIYQQGGEFTPYLQDALYKAGAPFYLLYTGLWNMSTHASIEILTNLITRVPYWSYIVGKTVLTGIYNWIKQVATGVSANVLSRVTFVLYEWFGSLIPLMSSAAASSAAAASAAGAAGAAAAVNVTLAAAAPVPPLQAIQSNVSSNLFAAPALAVLPVAQARTVPRGKTDKAWQQMLEREGDIGLTPPGKQLALPFDFSELERILAESPMFDPTQLLVTDVPFEYKNVQDFNS